MTERVLSQELVAETRLLRRNHDVTFRNNVRSAEVCKVLDVESSHIEMSHLRSFRNLTTCPKRCWTGKSCWIHTRRNT